MGAVIRLLMVSELLLSPRIKAIPGAESPSEGLIREGVTTRIGLVISDGVLAIRSRLAALVTDSCVDVARLNWLDCYTEETWVPGRTWGGVADVTARSAAVELVPAFCGVVTAAGGGCKATVLGARCPNHQPMKADANKTVASPMSTT
jgi:hypothetical protein